ASAIRDRLPPGRSPERECAGPARVLRRRLRGPRLPQRAGLRLRRSSRTFALLVVRARTPAPGPRSHARSTAAAVRRASRAWFRAHGIRHGTVLRAIRLKLTRRGRLDPAISILFAQVRCMWRPALMRHPKLARIVAVLVACSTAVVLSQETIDLGGIDRIKDEGVGRSEVMDPLRNLTDVHGPRLTGSPQFEEAAKWTAERLTAY